MVLPAKSVVCMPCHAATFSAADALTVLSLAVFLLGMAVVGSVWFSGGRAAADAGGTPTRPFRAAAGALLPGRILAIAGSLFLDGFLQRRLYAASRARWFWHALVFYPVAFRFAWGIAALLGSLWLPGWPATRAVLDKNHPLTASLFDLSGLLVVVGILGMAWRRRPGREAVGGTGLAPVDWPAFILLTGIMGVGFVLEGMRIAMTGTPPGAAWAFAGYALSRTMTGIELAGVYGHVWYLHAGLTAAFVAYLPFSRMRHMIMAPLSLAIGAAARFRRP